MFSQVQLSRATVDTDRTLPLLDQTNTTEGGGGVPHSSVCTLIVHNVIDNTILDTHLKVLSKHLFGAKLRIRV